MNQHSPRPMNQDEYPEEVTEQAIAWFARLRSDQISDSDWRGFREWLGRHPDHQSEYDRIVALWNEPELSLAVQKTANRMLSESLLPAAPRRMPRMKYALVSVGLLILFFGFMLPDVLIALEADYSTATGERKVVELSDGSTLTLNTNSAVAVLYSESRRGIRLLKGEAFFSVEKDANRPFVVESASFSARAVGTRYRVRRDGDEVRVDVLEGEVEVSGPALPALLVTRNQEARFGRNPRNALPTTHNPAASAWLQGRLVLTDVRLADALSEISRYQNGLIRIVNPTLQDLRVSGSFDLSDPIAILETLDQTLPIEILRFTDRMILVYSESAE